MVKNCLVLCLVFISFGQIYSVLNPKVVCYYENWFVWRNGNGKMTVDDVDSSLCTDIVYAYLGVKTDSTVSIPDDWLMVQKHDLDNFVKNKGKARALIAIGGYSLSGNFQSMTSSSSERSTFVSSVVSFLKQYDFDGISLDWSRGAWTDDEFNNFAKLLAALRSEFGTKYTLGITVAARAVNFDVKKVNEYVDFIAVQTYDLHGSWEHEVGHEAPIDWQVATLQEWYSAGATMNKLLMTIPLFAHTWILSDPSKTTPGSKASGPGKQGPYTQAEGKLSYNELCTEIQEDVNSWTVKRDNGAIYAVRGSTWVTFEDPTSCETKAKNVTTEGYGGVVVQALANEDFKGLCGHKYPLLNAINRGLNKDPVTVHTRGPSHTTPGPVVTADPSKICHKVGTVRDPKDCNVYHKCNEFLPGIFTDEVLNCPKNEAYDEKSDKCVDKSKVPGC